MSRGAVRSGDADEGFFAARRRRMVAKIEASGVADERVLEAMLAIPRHRFVEPHLHNQAYTEFALPIGHGQTISQPWVVARMTELMEIGPEDTVLEIGTGSGYQTALLARLARWVTSLERVPELARQAIERMRSLGIDNVKIVAFDGSAGWRQGAPYDRILVTAGAPATPELLLEQLGEGGRLLVPEGDRDEQRLMIYEVAAGRRHRREADAVSFVPLLGRHGWPG